MATYSGGAVVDYLKYVIGVDTSQMQKDARKAENIVGNMSSQIKKTLIGVAAVVGASFGIHQFVGFIKGATLSAARLEELDVVLRVVGDSAGYSFGYLKKEEEQIKALGIQTDSSRILLLRFMQSQLDVADAIKVANAARDLAIIGEQNTSQAAETLTYAIAAQRPILLRQYGIVTDLGEVFSKHAKILGKNAENLTEVEKRTAMLNVVLENAKRVEGAYEAAMTTAGKQLKSMPRYFYEASRAIGQDFLPTMRDAIFDIAEFIKAIGESEEHGIRKAFRGMGEVSRDLYQKLKDLLSFLRDHLPQIVKVLKALVAIKLALWIKNVAIALKAMEMRTLVGFIATVGLAVAAWTGALDKIFEWAEKVTGRMLGIKTHMARTKEEIEEVIDLLKKMKSLATSTQQPWEQIKISPGMFEEDKIKGWTKAGIEGIDALNKEMKELQVRFTELTGLEWRPEFIASLDALIEDFKAELAELTEVTEEEVAKGGRKILAIERDIAKERLRIAETYMRQYLAEEKQRLIEMVKLTKTDYRDKILELIDEINDKLNQTLNKAQNKIRDFADLLGYIFGGIADRIGQNFGALIHSIIGGITQLKTATSQFGIYGAGATIGFGVFDFFMSAVGKSAKTTERATAAMGELIEAIKRSKEQIEETMLGRRAAAIPLLEQLYELMKQWGIVIQEGQIQLPTGMPEEQRQLLSQILGALAQMGIVFEDLFSQQIPGMIEDIRGAIEHFDQVMSAETIPDMEEALKNQVDLTWGEGRKLIDYWAKAHDLSLQEQLDLLNTLKEILEESGAWTEDSMMDLTEAIRDLQGEIKEQTEEQRRIWRESLASFREGIDQFTHTQKQGFMDALNQAIAQIREATEAAWIEPLKRAIGGLANWLTGKTKGNLMQVLATLGGAYKHMIEMFTAKDWRSMRLYEFMEKLTNYLFKGGEAPGMADVANLVAMIKTGIGDLTEDMKGVIKSILEAVGLPITYDIKNLLNMLGILEDDIGDFEKLMSADTMKEFFEMLKQEAGMSFNRGRELIDYWTQMYGLSVQDQLKLYKQLKDLLMISGGWSEADLMSLNLILKRLEDEVTGTGGMTQVYRSVTAITERQGNLMLAVLNSINNYVKTILDKLTDALHELGLNPGFGMAGLGNLTINIQSINTNDPKDFVNRLEGELRGRGYSL